MPRFRTLSSSEVEKLKKRKAPRPDLLADYHTYLEGRKTGDWGAISLEQGESQRAVKRRLTTASKQRGVQIKYRTGDTGEIMFEIR